MSRTATIWFFKPSEKHWVLADQAVVSASAFATTLLAARALPPVSFGIFSSVLLFQLLALSVQHALITSPYLLLQPSQADRDAERRYTTEVLLIQLCLVLLLAATTAIITIIRPRAISQETSSLWWAFVAVAGYLIQDFLRRIFITRGQSLRALIIDLLTNGLQVTGLLCLHLRHTLTLDGCLMVCGLTFIPSILAGFWYVGWRATSPERLTQTIYAHLSQGKWLLLTCILQWWAGNSFVVTAGLLLGAEAFGALRLAQSILGILNVVLQAFENYVMPRAAKAYGRSTQHLSLYLRKVSSRAGALLIPLLVLLFIFAAPLFQLAGGGHYEQYTGVMRGLCLLYLFIFFGYPVRIALRVLGENKAFFLGYLLATLFSLLAAASVIHAWGAAGAVAGLILNQALLIGFWLFILRNKIVVYGNHPRSIRES